MATLDLSPANQFSFTCPIFNVETRFSACGKLRNMVYRGEAPPVRRGCQACMASNKCPAIHAMNDVMRSENKSHPDYSAQQPVNGKLRADILERIRPVVFQERFLAIYEVPQAEADLIRTANERIDKQLGSAPKKVEKYTRQAAPKAKTPAPVASTINKAAATGDMAAAIS